MTRHFWNSAHSTEYSCFALDFALRVCIKKTLSASRQHFVCTHCTNSARSCCWLRLIWTRVKKSSASRWAKFRGCHGIDNGRAYKIVQCLPFKIASVRTVRFSNTTKPTCCHTEYCNGDFINDVLYFFVMKLSGTATDNVRFSHQCAYWTRSLFNFHNGLPQCTKKKNLWAKA